MNNPIVVPMSVSTDSVRVAVDSSATNLGVPTASSVETVGVPMEMSVTNHGLTPSMSEDSPGLPMQLSISMGGGGGGVTGVKGNAESTYRTGNVNLTADDIGVVVPTKTSDLQNDSGYITSASVPTKTSQLTNDSNFVVDQHYVHTDNNFTDADESKLANLENLSIYVGGQECRVTLINKSERQGVEGLIVWYDDGTLDGGVVFLPDGVGINTVATTLQGQMETFSISMSGNVISLTGSRGTNSSVTLPLYNGGYE